MFDDAWKLGSEPGNRLPPGVALVRSNRRPVSWPQTPSGAILVEQPQGTLDRVALYARVEQRSEVGLKERQLGRFPIRNANGIALDKPSLKWALVSMRASEIGPTNRRSIVTTIGVEDRDRLARFGSQQHGSRTAIMANIVQEKLALKQSRGMRREADLAQG